MIVRDKGLIFIAVLPESYPLSYELPEPDGDRNLLEPDPTGRKEILDSVQHGRLQPHHSGRQPGAEQVEAAAAVGDEVRAHR